MSILTLNISVSGLQIGSTIKRKACDLTLLAGMTMALGNIQDSKSLLTARLGASPCKNNKARHPNT